MTCGELAAKGRELLALAERDTIPYVPNGGTLAGMDCQGLIEYLMAQCGVKRGWKGSNDMWRSALKWSGTPEAFVALFGALPEGAAVFILENDGGEPDEYKRTDGERFGGNKGNASHVGLYLGTGSVVHASASNARVCESTRFDGCRAVANGGWNMVGLWADVDYGADVEAKSSGGGAETADVPCAPIQANASEARETAKWKPRYSHITVKRGCVGGAVREAQTGLWRLGYRIDIDGEFGPKTDEIVRCFQAEHGLEADGIVGRLTWRALIEAVGTPR